MKYRIKVVSFADGRNTFYPQYKKFIFWRNFIKFSTNFVDDYFVNVWFNDEIRARKYINDHKAQIYRDKLKNKKVDENIIYLD